MLQGRALGSAIMNELGRHGANTASGAVPLKGVGQHLKADPWDYCQTIATLIDRQALGIIGTNIFRI